METNYLNDTICAPLTVRGESAIAVLRISGNSSFEIASKILKLDKDIKKYESRKAHLSYIIDENNNIIDKILFTRYERPNSFTGENSIEISTHGSPMIVDKTMELLISNGARLAKKGEFTKRAFINGKMSLTEAESIIDIIESKTETILNSATKNLLGSLDKKIKQYSEKLLEILSLLNVSIDFDEEFIEDTTWDKINKEIKKIIKLLKNDIDESKKMLKEKRGLVIILLGSTNVGKSTLMNVILNENRAIVSEIAGTTRDYISEEVRIKGHHVRLYDTAGLRENADELEKMGIEKTKELIDMADIAIYINDHNNKIDKKLISHFKENPATRILTVLNKIDKKKNPSDTDDYDIQISAKEKINVDRLMNKLILKIEDLTSKERLDSAIINQRQLDYFIRLKNLLDEAVENIKNMPYEEIISNQIYEAINVLEKIKGKKINEEMLNNIFNRFCIGK